MAPAFVLPDLLARIECEAILDDAFGGSLIRFFPFGWAHVIVFGHPIGGSGFIGQTISKSLLSAGYEVTVLDIKAPDNLSCNHYVSFDLRNYQNLFFQEYHPVQLVE